MNIGYETVFGSLLTEKLKISSAYYGKGPASVAVWSFSTLGVIEFFPASLKNTEYISVSTDQMRFGSAAITLQENMSGRSKKCVTFLSPRLSSEEEFGCSECEVYSLEHYHRESSLKAGGIASSGGTSSAHSRSKKEGTGSLAESI